MGRAGYETARLRLARLRVEGDEARQVGARHALAISAGALNVERVGIWLFDARDQRIDCMQLYTAATRSFSAGTSLFAKDHPDYFAALASRRAIAADDARTDPATHELTDGYLAPNGITSMLDAPIIRGGRIVGVVCHEHIGPARAWQQQDIDFASTVADMVALLFEQSDRLTLEASLMAHNEQALESQKTEALQRLARAVGHDINNVLTSLSLATERLTRHADPGVAQAAVDISHAVDLVHTLATQLLELGRSAPLAGGPTDVRRLLEREHAALNALLAGRATVTIEDRAEDAVVSLDPKELEQILLNLAANARDAISDSGHVGIVLREPNPEDLVTHDRLILEVVDDGAGMDDETRARVFEPYFTTKQHGTGLGLALVYATVVRAGGSLSVESSPGRGTRFVAALPRTR